MADGARRRRVVACATWPAAGAGSRYGFSIDGGPVRPDPRSPSQPDGVDGLSAVVDHRAFAWSDATWRGVALPGSVLYELHVGTFSAEGTFDGVIAHLDHLVELGVDAIELLPVCEFSGNRGWGYDGVDLFAPHHAYGGPEGLKRLVDACHRAGLGVVLDVVYNHLGPAGNYLAEFGPYFTDRHQTGWGDAVNMDGPGSDEVRRFVVDNALMWLRDYHGDGLRLDAVHAIVDTSARHILEQLAVEVDALAAHVRKPLFLIAESDRNDPALVRARAAGGLGLAAAWADEWHHGLHTVLTGEHDGYYEDFGTGAVLAKALRQAWVHDGTYSPHRGRAHGRPVTGLTGDRFVIATQTHDQVGNRATGERLAALTTEGRVKVAAALLLTAPFVPMLFMGEEWAASTPFQYFTDHQDPALGQAVTEGRRHEFAAFGWDPDGVPDPQADRDVRTLGAALGRAPRGRPRPGARVVPPADRPAPAHPGAGRRQPGRRHCRSRRRHRCGRRPAGHRRPGRGQPGPGRAPVADRRPPPRPGLRPGRPRPERQQVVAARRYRGRLSPNTR